MIELDLEARQIGETLILNRSLDPLYGYAIDLNDLNVPLELRRNRVDDLEPTVEESEVKEKQEKDKVRSKPDKNGKHGEARQCQSQSQSRKKEK
nr:hypothetical protein [Tanacetum cinerariifolium]